MKQELEKEKIVEELNNKLMEMQNEYLNDMEIVGKLLEICQSFIEKWKRTRKIEV